MTTNLKSIFLERLVLLSCLGMLAALYIKTALTRGFGIDDLSRLWILSGSFADLVNRLQSQGQGPIYFLLAWLVRQLTGGDVFTIRMLSVFWTLQALLSFYYLARLFLPQASAFFGTIILGFSTQVVSHSSEISPYPFLLWLLIVSFWALLKFLKDKEQLFFFIYLLVNLLIPLTHQLHLLVIIPQSVICAILIKQLKISAITAAVIIGAGICCLLGILLVSHILPTAHQAAQSVSFLTLPGFQFVLDSLASLMYLPLSTLALVIAYSFLNDRFIKSSCAPAVSWRIISIPVILGFTIFVSAPICIWLLSKSLNASFFIPRYFLHHLIAVPLLVSSTLSLILSRKRLLILSIVYSSYFALSLWTIGDSFSEGWELLRNVRSSHIQKSKVRYSLYIESGLIEGARLKNISDPILRKFLLSPAIYYGLNANPLPLGCNRPFIKSFIRSSLRSSARRNSYLDIVSRDVRIAIDNKWHTPCGLKVRQLLRASGLKSKIRLSRGIVRWVRFSSQR